MNDFETLRYSPPPQETPRSYRRGIFDLSDRSRHQQERFAHDIEWKVVGPMPVDEFLDEFFPNSPNSTTEIELRAEGVECDDVTFDSVPDEPKREEEMYEGLVRMKRRKKLPSDLTNPSAAI
jgi:hypothetical protein